MQLSYPLTPEAKCSKVESDNCLVAINLQDGPFSSLSPPFSKLAGSFKSVFTNYTIYDTVPGSLDSNGNIFAFIEGITSLRLLFFSHDKVLIMSARTQKQATSCLLR